MSDDIEPAGGDKEASGCVEPTTPLQALLGRLGGAGEAPELAYEQLRRRLVAFFRLRFPPRAEALADIVLDRLATRLGDGTRVEHVAHYALGIARLVALEAQAKEQRERRAAEELAMDIERGLGEQEEPDPALAALAACLETLGSAAAQFILQYYAQDGGAARIRHRHQLATQLGLTENALRNRALRLRIALERCVTGHLAAAAGNHPGS